jgi:hypothetical protein
MQGRLQYRQYRGAIASENRVCRVFDAGQNLDPTGLSSLLLRRLLVRPLLLRRDFDKATKVDASFVLASEADTLLSHLE